MNAVIYTEYGDPDVLHVADVEEPHAGPGEVRIAVRATGVNPIDWKLRGGMMGGDGPFPAIDGREARPPTLMKIFSAPRISLPTWTSRGETKRAWP